MTQRNRALNQKGHVLARSCLEREKERGRGKEREGERKREREREREREAWYTYRQTEGWKETDTER